MKRLFSLLVFIPLMVAAQADLKGELSFIGNQAWNADNAPATQISAGYIPTWSYLLPMKSGRLFDLEVAGNISGAWDVQAGDNETKVDFYRLWARYSTPSFEARLGLQKITFGPAKLFRPLQWFDTIDPRDPQQLTEGVKALKLRWTYEDNSELLLWSIVNDDLENPSAVINGDYIPELGGRLSLPFFFGSEMAFLVHSKLERLDRTNDDISRVGFDYYIDFGLAMWFESSKLLGSYDDDTRSQTTVGADYTFSLGNGVTLTAEYYNYKYYNEIVLIDDGGNISPPPKYVEEFYGLIATYPLNIMDNLSAISVFYPEEKISYNYLSWQRAWDNWLLQGGVFFLTGTDTSVFATNFKTIGTKGLQIRLVFNH